MNVSKGSKFGDFLASDVYRALNKGRKVFDGSQFRVVLSREEEPEPYWSAISLEMNVVATGYTQREAIMNLIALMAFHVEDYIANGIEEDIFIPAPLELWQSFPKARKVSTNYITELPLPLSIQARQYAVAYTPS